MAAFYEAFKLHFHNAEIQSNIRESKEEQYQEGFLRDLFVNILGYELNPNPDFRLTLIRNLENWPWLDFKAFLKELKMLKISLTLGEEAEWMSYFNEQKAMAQALQAQMCWT